MNKLCNQTENNEEEIMSIYADQKEKKFWIIATVSICMFNLRLEGFSSIDFPCNLAIERVFKINNKWR